MDAADRFCLNSCCACRKMAFVIISDQKQPRKRDFRPYRLLASPSLDCSCVCREMASVMMAALAKKIRCFVTWGQTAQTVGPGPSAYQANRPTRLCQSSCCTVGRSVPFVYSSSFPDEVQQQAGQCPMWSRVPCHVLCLKGRSAPYVHSALFQISCCNRQASALCVVLFPFR